MDKIQKQILENQIRIMEALIDNGCMYDRIAINNTIKLLDVKQNTKPCCDMDEDSLPDNLRDYTLGKDKEEFAKPMKQEEIKG